MYEENLCGEVHQHYGNVNYKASIAYFVPHGSYNVQVKLEHGVMNDEMYRKHFSRLFESAPERQKWTSSRHSTHHAAGSRVRHLGLRRTEVRGLQEKQPARTEASNHRLLGKISVRKDQGLTYVRGKREASAFRGPEHKAVLLRLFSRQVFPDGLKYLRTRHCDLLPYLFVLRPVESLQG